MLKDFGPVTNLSGKLIGIGRPEAGGSSGVRRVLPFVRFALRHTLALPLVFATAACTLPGPAVTNAPPADPVLAFVAAGPVGVPANIAAPAYGGTVTVEVQSQYSAASGDTCRTYTVSAPGGARKVLACQDGGVWQNIGPLVGGPADVTTP